MPFAPRAMCSVAGCQNRASRGSLCVDHQKQRNKQIDERRDSKVRSLYTPAWAKASRMFLRENPYCLQCSKEGRLELATVTDHTIDHRGDYERFWDSSNWMPLCKRHHDSKTMRELNEKRRPR